MADSLYAAFSDTLKLQMTSPQALEGGFNQFATQVGVETELLEERWVNRKGRRQYWRTAKFSTFPEPFMLRFVIGTDGKIEGIGMNPKSQAPAIDPSA